MEEDVVCMYESLFTSSRQEEDEKDDGTQEIPDDFALLADNLSTALKTKGTELKRLVSAECAELQEDEMIALKAIFEHELELVDENCKSFKLTISETSNIDDDDRVVDLWFSIPVNYPNDIPIFEIEGHGGLSMTLADQLYDMLLEEALKRKHETMIFDLVSLAKEFLLANMKSQEPVDVKDETDIENDKASEDGDHREEKNVFYYKPDYITSRPSQFTGPIYKLMERIPSHLQIVSIENILREDLVKTYMSCKEKFEEKYSDRARKHPQQYHLQHSLGFHGTSKSSIASIVRTGLKIPGSESGIRVEHGSRFGVGIYLSPSPEYSLSYSDDESLLVCSVLLGNQLKLQQDGRARCREPYGTYDSVLSPCGNEIVLFSAKQVLPCFIIRLARKFRSDEDYPLFMKGAYASSIAKFTRKTNETEQEKMERLKRRAQKHLPFGYGPSNKIEAVADSSDDEEEYGDYQNDRYQTYTSRHIEEKYYYD